MSKKYSNDYRVDRVIAIQGSQFSKRDESLVIEEPLELVINGESLRPQGNLLKPSLLYGLLDRLTAYCSLAGETAILLSTQADWPISLSTTVELSNFSTATLVDMPGYCFCYSFGAELASIGSEGASTVLVRLWLGAFKLRGEETACASYLEASSPTIRATFLF